MKKEFPILEFDSSLDAFISPKQTTDCKELGINKLVICYFKEVIAKLLENGEITLVKTLPSEGPDCNIYKYVDGTCCIVQGFIGAPAMAGYLEEFIAMGFTDIICCGGAGVLRRDLQVGHLIVPTSAIRDEGMSYHYLEPSRTVDANIKLVNHIENYLTKNNIPYILGTTWTTDAFYRETKDKIELRKTEGAICVEMEQAGLMAVAKFRGVNFAAIIYGGDDLSGVIWDKRDWCSRTDIRYNLCELVKNIIVEFKG